jgi:hypothetical protein
MNNLLPLNELPSNELLDNVKAAIDYVRSDHGMPEGVVSQSVSIHPHPVVSNVLDVTVNVCFARPDLIGLIEDESYDVYESSVLTLEQGKDLTEELNWYVNVLLRGRLKQNAWDELINDSILTMVAQTYVDEVFGKDSDEDFQLAAHDYFVKKNAGLINVTITTDIENCEYSPYAYDTSEVQAAYAEKFWSKQ